METATNNETSSFSYNWNDIDTGDLHANNSQFFFMQQHPKHERSMEDEENAEFDNPSNILEDKSLFEVVHVAKVMEKPAATKPAANGIVEQVNQLKISPRVPLKPKCVVNNKKVNDPAIPSAGSHLQPAKTSHEPNVYRFTKIYDAKKKARLETIRELEKKQRQFHSQPAPNFDAIRAAHDKKERKEKFTVPTTPAVLRRHKESQEKKKKMREEFQASQRPKPFVSNSDPDVLRKRPFTLHPTDKPTTVVQPFSLQTLTRLKERRQFDENYKTESERKQQEKEEQQRLEDERLRKEARAATGFKAQPNPFK